jgi:pimeloyl-ACP methyl ester carboxylesterase
LVHGAYGGSWAWHRVTPLLERPAAAIDLPGRGTRPVDLASVTVETCVDAVLADADAAGFERFVLVGHSLGGVTVTATAARVPERIAHAVFVAAMIPKDGASGFDSLPGDQRELAHRRSLSAENVVSVIPEDQYRALYEGDLTDDDLDWLMTTRVPEANRLFFEPVRMFRSSVPTTYLKLLRDRSIPPAAADALIANLPAPPIVREVDSGHYVSLTDPVACAACINEAARE